MPDICGALKSTTILLMWFVCVCARAGVCGWVGVCECGCVGVRVCACVSASGCACVCVCVLAMQKLVASRVIGLKLQRPTNLHI